MQRGGGLVAEGKEGQRGFTIFEEDQERSNITLTLEMRARAEKAICNQV